MLALEREALAHARAARVSLAAASAQAGRINHLLESHPLREWQGKQDRLQSVILQFRGENARLRGLDPANVIAFAQPSRIVFPELDEEEDLRRPTEFDRLLEELTHAQAEYARVVGVCDSDRRAALHMEGRVMKLSLMVIAFVARGRGLRQRRGSESTNAGTLLHRGNRHLGKQDEERARRIEEAAQRADRKAGARRQADSHRGVPGRTRAGSPVVRQHSHSPESQAADGSDRRRLEDFRSIAHMQTSILFDSARAKQIQHTDIFGTLSRAADYAKASRNRGTTLLLLSDMMNETPEVEMTSMQGFRVVPGFAERADARRIPSLTGVCVVVAGADVSSARGAAVRDFWNKYFEAAGTNVSSDNYRNMISDPAEVNCN